MRWNGSIHVCSGHFGPRHHFLTRATTLLRFARRAQQERRMEPLMVSWTRSSLRRFQVGGRLVHRDVVGGHIVCERGRASVSRPQLQRCAGRSQLLQEKPRPRHHERSVQGSPSRSSCPLRLRARNCLLRLRQRWKHSMSRQRFLTTLRQRSVPMFKYSTSSSRHRSGGQEHHSLNHTSTPD